MKHTIDSAYGKQLYSQRIGTVEPVFGNLRHNKLLMRLKKLRRREQANTQWQLYRLEHNREKLGNSAWRR